MGNFVKDGSIFTIAAIVFFVTIDAFVINGLLATTDYGSSGFPLKYYEGWGPCQPGAADGCTRSSTANMALNIIIAIAIGFGISYAKNRKDLA
ncbi:MAG: hypothetical protein HY544_03305 [Candidatus Diapherotrites archaeon]|uniref:Uncharacterized protein n=1 Tax=Candidatus Iainarchaeum sp. TaxID=3101447 RepID=A0A8T3YKF4_9ARCH|nr:hypothetical protein [Candidatus Diapherotrites archaeon]